MKKAENKILAYIFIFSIILRLGLITGLKTYSIPAKNNHWAFGYEMGRVAQAIASGNGFSSPFGTGDEPTAWLAPVYPFILSIIFRIFGIYSSSSAVCILLLNSVFSGLTALFIYKIADSCLSRTTGILSAMLFMVYPPALWHSINTIWHTTLSCLLITMIVYYVLLHEKQDAKFNPYIIGFLMGLGALTNPVIISIIPFILYRYSKDTESKIKNNVRVIALTFLITLSPWIIRNYIVFGRFILIKSTLGVELRLGNNRDATGIFSMKGNASLHPTLSRSEMELFKKKKEIAYNRYCLIQAANYIIDNPMRFFKLTAKRVALFWLGEPTGANIFKGNLKIEWDISVIKKIITILPLPFFLVGIIAAKKSNINISIFYYVLLSYPCVYYITHVANRYRHPVEPIIVIFSSYGLMAIFETVKYRYHSISINRKTRRI